MCIEVSIVYDCYGDLLLQLYVSCSYIFVFVNSLLSQYPSKVKMWDHILCTCNIINTNMTFDDHMSPTFEISSFDMVGPVPAFGTSPPLLLSLYIP